MGDGMCDLSSLDSFGLWSGSEQPHRNKPRHHSEGGPWLLISSRRLTKAARISSQCWSGDILGDGDILRDGDTEHSRHREDDEEALEDRRPREGDRLPCEIERPLLRRLRRKELEEELSDGLRPLRVCMRPFVARA